MKAIKDIKIAYKLWALTTLTIISLIGFGIYSYTTMNEVKINGDLYEEIVLGKDLIADILPPPEYLVESYLTTYQMLHESDPNKLELLINKGKKLEEDYFTRHKFWQDKLEDGPLKKNLVEDSYITADKFFKLRDGEYITALKNGDKAAAENLLNSQLKSYYEEHRGSIDKVVKLAESQNSVLELDTQQLIETRTLFITIVLIVLLAVNIIFSSSIIKAINIPIYKLIDVVNRVATGNENLTGAAVSISNGDTSVNLRSDTINIDINSEDEIGDLASSVKRIVKSQEDLNNSFKHLINTTDTLLTETLLLTDSAFQGKLEFRASSNKFTGSYKKLIEGINNTIDALLEPVKEGVEAIEKIAKGNLGVRIQSTYKGDHQIIKNSVNELAESLSKLLIDVSEAVQATASASNEISASAEEMAAGSQEQSSQTSEVASAVEQMTSTILQTTKNASSAANFSKKAGDSAKNGGDVVKQTVAGMNRIANVVGNAASTVRELGNSSNQIGEIIQVIDDIADQTNLLALNAAIEAARAGEQGRGFAVVADEVRKLAERTTKATKEIAAMIKQIQKDTGNAVESIESGTKEVEIGKELANKAILALDEIIGSTNDTIDVVNQVAAASEEQSSAAEQISKSIESISNVTHESAAGIQQIARASEDLSNLTTNLQNLVSKFKINSSYAASNKSNLSVRANGKIIHG